MKSTCSLSLVLLLSIGCMNIAHANFVGTVFEDTTQSGKFGPGNVPLPGVLVVVTNTSGTFSNAMFSTAPSGSFSLVLSDPTESYKAFVVPSSLPAGSAVEQPVGGVYTFSPGAGNPPVEGDFLVSARTNPQLQAAGFVLLDVNRTGQFALNDPGVPGVLVIVTNATGTFSNASLTTGPGGSFSIPLASFSDKYMEYVLPSSLPVGTNVLLPASGLYTFTLGADQTFAGNFLIGGQPSTNAPQAHAQGVVLLDVNQTGQFALNDPGVPGVLVIVTNASGTFSNASLTTGPGGSFSIPLASSSDKYLEYVLPSSLPVGTNVLLPTAGLYTFTLGANQIFGANFLIGGQPHTNAPQAHAQGVVLLDVNQTGQFEQNDLALPNVLVVITNVSGTFSNASLTAAPAGAFTIPLGSATDTYVEYLQPATLPAGAMVEQPTSGLYTFTLSPNNLEFKGNFLVSGVTTPNILGTNNCSMEAHGTIGGHESEAQFTFSGSAFSPCDLNNGVTGEWNILARDLRLHFTGSVFVIGDCGEQTNSSGVVTRFIDFQGAGNLIGFHGPKTRFGVVTFTGRAEQNGHSRQNPDRLYCRVDTANGTTVLLISGDTSNPSNVVAVALSTGEVKIDTNPCQGSGGNDDGQGNHDGDSDHGHDHNGHNEAGGNQQGDSNGKHGDS